ncbi:hypothetical protein A3C09_01190 [Candidatus Uhrbacteria bacterium RIFCSPHIGHO2_02_FULL_47_44]|nr:MAG: hypothetical protein A3C09_01190 [Candidatus Uhrbacteria bacterium RIFCSPHIGHO2_02_FULL_47_44]OGL80702.1 MAG: hypothetical protein A3B20_04905 [Candidatus Uhrbacteria bacterium RIFCSPLOWO2_01_FULL_47_17]
MGEFNEQQLRETLCFPHVNSLKNVFLEPERIPVFGENVNGFWPVYTNGSSGASFMDFSVGTNVKLK